MHGAKVKIVIIFDFKNKIFSQRVKIQCYTNLTPYSGDARDIFITLCRA
jgi:hypothetical protein